MAAATNLHFKNCKIVEADGGKRTDVHHHVKLVKRLLRYGNFSIFQNGGHLPYWILKSLYFIG